MFKYHTQLTNNDLVVGGSRSCALLVRVNGRALFGQIWDSVANPGFWQTATFSYNPIALAPGVHTITVYGKSGQLGDTCSYSRSILEIETN